MTVYLVGAGPGDPELITLKAIKALNRADVVIYDRLANEEILQHSPNAKLIYVGKKAGEHYKSQEEINNIIIKEAAMGKVMEVPDIALDKHTKRGQEMGRGSKHFFEEGTKVIPQLKIDNDYRERYGKILEKYDPNHVVPNAFKYNPGQY